MPCKINNTSNFDVSEIEDLIQDLFSFSQDRFGFQDSPVLNLVSDGQNTSPLGKTAHYDPNSMEITIYVDGRHPKDIMRSFSHELVHHNQNENGQFANIVGQGGSNYAQTNPHLRKMEKEAYLKGNMCFRDWEDGYKSSNPNILNERRIYKMSIKDWKNKELNKLLNEKWGFSMNLNKLNESKKPDFPDVDGDGDREEPISKAKKGEIPPQLKKYVKEKQKDEEDSEESEEEVNESEDKKEKFKKGLKGELDDTANQKVDPELKQKIIDSLTISQLEAALKKKRKKKIDEQEQQPANQDEKLTTTSGGRYSTKDPEMVEKVQQLAKGIIKNPSIIKSPAGIETIIQKMIATLGASDKTLSQTKMDMAKVKDKK